ncbi:MAG: energy-coupling factor ABC transporter ATP-binding protein [Caldimicrobium sp.]
MDNSLRLKVRIESFTLEEPPFSLRNISFELYRGEALALLGPSGSGKTTLLKVLDGLYKNYKGEILLDGQEIKFLSPREIYQKMGLLFQNPEEQLFAEKVFDDVAFGPRNMGWKEEEVKASVKKALELVNLQGFEKRAIHKLSFGEKKRVALAGLLAMGQEILLLDEPTLGLDPLLEEAFLNLLINLKKRGYSIIMATHNIDLVPNFADKVLVLKNGEMALFGELREILIKREDLKKFNLRAPIMAELFFHLKANFPYLPLPLTLDEAFDILSKHLKTE